MEINELLDRVKEVRAFPSDYALARELRTTSTQIRMWRQGRHRPKDETLLEICDLAQIPREAGLMWLNVWRTEGEAQQIYSDLAERLMKADSKKKRAA
jgi:transcriptional regulator with XRE-family HTH domain